MILTLKAQKADYLSVVGGSLFIALLSQISIPLWFTPVPLTLQTLAIFLVGHFLGSKRGLMATALYLAECGLGFPFLAGGAAGFLQMFGPTGGYFLGFLFAAYLVPFKRGLWLATGCIWFFGALWLSPFVGGYQNAFLLGVLPFIVGDLLKIMIAKCLFSSMRAKG